ncbi:hypothetical protein LIER_40361 [Lithospermum erythrorhizon]|uniref:Uncharacterized protein n=1 Tax=Lithospermum erythrorhizon TaxID=34254 RepID=A0AAV3QWE1_LITER
MGLVNHSIGVLTEIIDRVARFNEFEMEEKRGFYILDGTNALVFCCNYDMLKAKPANWRDYDHLSYSQT